MDEQKERTGKAVIAQPKIERVPEKESGMKDSVQFCCNCVLTRFSITGGKKRIRNMKMHPCKILASAENGTVSISVGGAEIQVAVRMDEIMAVAAEAVKYGMEIGTVKTGARREGAGK